MAKKIFLALGAVVVVFVAVVASRPSAFRVARATTIAATPERVFAEVNDFHAWKAWSPWEKLDPDMKRTFGGPASGAGATYAWVGNDKVGEGRMTIEKSEWPSLVGVKLEFVKPFAATNQTTFTFAQEGEGTKVQWVMQGENGFLGKAMCMIMDMDKTVGGDFERGLAAMKADVEGAAGKGALEAKTDAERK